MPTGPPDSRCSPQGENRPFLPPGAKGRWGSAGAAGEGDTNQPGFIAHDVEPVAERIIRAAMESGDFDDLPGTGEPIPGAGRVDDELWWVRSWLERNRDPDAQESARGE